MDTWADLRSNPKLTTSFVTAAIFLVLVVGLLCVWWDVNPLLGGLAGTAFGWATGILLAPYDEEEKRFQRISKGVAGFLSGYAVGKLDRVFDLLLDKTEGHPRILDTSLQRTFWIGVTCFVVTMVTVFVARTYWQVEEEKKGRAHS